MNSIVVFCASGIGTDEVYADTARNVGELLVSQNITLIYGGGRVGLMGVVADTVLQNGGKAIGVIPEFLATQEVAHRGLTELIVVESMHQRKTKMAELCEGVMALPGGFGTLEELTEMLTWSQLSLHQKPIGILNVNGYYNHLEKLFAHMVTQGLLKPENQALAIFDEAPENLLEKMKSFERPDVSTRLRKERT